MEVIHTAVWVSDLDATRAFYEDGLGLEQSWQFEGDDGVVNHYVGGDGGAEIQFKYDPDDHGGVAHSGIDHVAVSVEDTDEAFERIVDETGCAVVREPMTVEAAGARAAFVADPDGYVVELVSPLD